MNRWIIACTLPHCPTHNRITHCRNAHVYVRRKKRDMSVHVHAPTINLHSDVIAKEQVTEQEDSLSAVVRQRGNTSPVKTICLTNRRGAWCRYDCDHRYKYNYRAIIAVNPTMHFIGFNSQLRLAIRTSQKRLRSRKWLWFTSLVLLMKASINCRNY